MKQHKFWIVFGMNGYSGGSPTYIHTSKKLAKSEAKRLARENPKKQFYVMKPIKGFTAKMPLEKVRISGAAPDDMPI